MGQNLRPHRSIERTKAINFPRLSTSRDRQIIPNLQRCQRLYRLGVIRPSARSPSRNVHEYSVGASPNANLTLLLGLVSIKLRGSNLKLPMSALGQKRTSEQVGHHVRFTPKSGHWISASKCPLCAKSGRQAALPRRQRAGSFAVFSETRFPASSYSINPMSEAAWAAVLNPVRN